jgi:hypothetical protein
MEVKPNYPESLEELWKHAYIQEKTCKKRKVLQTNHTSQTWTKLFFLILEGEAKGTWAFSLRRE